MTDTVTIHDKSLEARQRAVARDMPRTKRFMGGDAHIDLRVDEEVYEQARLANLAGCDGANIWDDPEFRRDMAERHPELRANHAGATFNMNPEGYGGLLKRRVRYGRVATRTRYRGHRKITDDYRTGVRTVLDTLEGTETRFDLQTGQLLEEPA